MKKQLEIDSGAVTLSINGDESRVITFYPKDLSFAERFNEMSDAISHKQDQLKVAEMTEDMPPEKQIQIAKEFLSFVRGEIDKVFGPGTSQIVFGDHVSIGSMIQFFRGITPYIQQARMEEVSRYLPTSDSDPDVMDV